MDRQPSAPGASAISEGSGNLGPPSGDIRGVVSPRPAEFGSIEPSSSRLFAQVRTADAGIAGPPDQWHMQPFRPARSWVTPQSKPTALSLSARVDIGTCPDRVRELPPEGGSWKARGPACPCSPP